MNYVLIEATDGAPLIKGSNRLSLGNTRCRDALAAFQDAVRTTFNATSPDIIAIKAKPEKGGMRAGAAALKMEGIVLANAPCATEFVSGAQINRCGASQNSLHNYLDPAFKTAAVVLARVSK